MTANRRSGTHQCQGLVRPQTEAGVFWPDHGVVDGGEPDSGGEFMVEMTMARTSGSLLRVSA